MRKNEQKWEKHGTLPSKSFFLVPAKSPFPKKKVINRRQRLVKEEEGREFSEPGTDCKRAGRRPEWMFFTENSWSGACYGLDLKPKDATGAPQDAERRKFPQLNRGSPPEGQISLALHCRQIPRLAATCAAAGFQLLG